MDYWPRSLFPASEVRWFLAHRTIQGGIPVELGPRTSGTSGGGLWVCEMSGIWLRKREQIMAARALDAIMDGGLTSMVVGSCESRFARWAAPTEPVPHSDGSPFSDESFYAGASATGTVTADAALRATTLYIDLPEGVSPDVYVISINHPIKGQRRYQIARVGDAGEVTIRPPLREAATIGTEVDFSTGACVMKLANAVDFFAAIQMGRFSNLSPTFVEAF